MTPPGTTQDPSGLQLVDVVLTNLALNYRPKGFVYDEIVSYMDVAKNHGEYPVWTQADFFRDDVVSEVDDRAPTPEIDFSYSLAPYILKNRRLKVSLTPEEQAQAHNALRFRETKVNGLLDRMAMIRERRLAAALRKTTNGGLLNLGGGVTVKWDAGTVGTPATIEQDIKAARKAARDATGQLCDAIVLPWNVGYAIALDPTVRDIIKYDATGQAKNIIELGDRVLPAQLHGLDVIIAGAMVNTAADGAAMSLSEVWGKNAILIKRVETNAWGEPATCYALRGSVLNGSASEALGSGETPTFATVDHWFTPDPPVEHIRAWDKRQEKVVAADVGYEIAAVIS